MGYEKEKRRDKEGNPSAKEKTIKIRRDQQRGFKESILDIFNLHL